MKRPRSLFARLLVAQVLLAVVLTFLLAALFYAERNRTVAQLVAARWAPVLKLAASGATADEVRQRAPGLVHESAIRPEAALEIASMTPRLAMVRSALADDGVSLADLTFGRSPQDGATAPLLWLALRAGNTASEGTSNGVLRWIGFESDLIEPRMRERVVLAIVLLAALAIAASAFIARRLSRPLEALRARIAADDAGGGPLPHASAEVQAIDEAWRVLRRSLDLQERERALLLAGVSHDLRSPLGRIRMAAELLPDGEGIAQRREAIVRNAVLADRLVGSFLDHVRSGELPLDETVDVAALAQAVAERQERQVAELRVESPSSLMVSGVNAVLIERVIANLLDNAFAHGRPPVVLRVEAVEGQVRVDVEDAGPGIAPDQQEILLQAFARADASRSRPGLGLGLAVVQRVALRLGGGVSFISSPTDVGSIVRVAWRHPS